MDNIKKCWLTKQNERLCVLSIESASPEIDSPNKVTIDEMRFPNEPTETHPKRHVVTLGLLSEKDLMQLKKLLDKTLLQVTLTE